MATSSNYDPVQISLIWCKLCLYLLQFLSTSSAIIVCFTAFDQYLLTSHHNQIRQLSTFKLAKRVVSTLAVLTGLYSTPTLVFQDIRRSNCVIYNPSYNYYFSFVHLCINIGLLPIVISTVFSLLAFGNVRRIIRRQIPIVRRRLDQQLTAMILVRVALFVIIITPFVCIRAYQLNQSVDSTNSYAVAVDQLIRSISTTFFNINSAASFYVFLGTSSRFRGQVKYFFRKKLWHKLRMIKRNSNEVAPAYQQQMVEAQVSAIEVD